MPVDRPELEALIARVTADISGRDGGREILKRAGERVFGNVVAGVAHGLYGRLDYIGKQLLPTDADLEGLTRWGVLLELPQKGGARASGGTAELRGTPGTVVPEGTHWLAPSGAVIVTRATATIGAPGTVVVQVAALLPGVAGNVEAEETLSIETSIDELEDEATVLAPLTGGTVREDIEVYRGRILRELRRRKRGGGQGDYETWMLECEGVTRAWEVPHRNGVGTVSCAWVYDDRPDILPTPADVAEMQAYLDGKKPLDMRAVYCVPPVLAPVDLSVLLTPATSTVAANVFDVLRALFRVTELSEALPLSVVDEAISSAAGEQAHTITAISSLTPSTWHLLVLGHLTTNAS